MFGILHHYASILISRFYTIIIIILIFTAVGGNSGAIEAEQNEAYRVTSGEQELATHTDESMYSYPVVDPDQSIEAKTNNAYVYAVSIVTEKNVAYKPVSTYTATGGTILMSMTI